mmetsp:Transcript_12088/g.31017  ORF Transcript_12088/g.31017 Transcript_12088/m.31017 type:complete len:384 (-) Transcript_12088:161-1312(-)
MTSSSSILKNLKTTAAFSMLSGRGNGSKDESRALSARAPRPPDWRGRGPRAAAQSSCKSLPMFRHGLPPRWQNGQTRQMWRALTLHIGLSPPWPRRGWYLLPVHTPRARALAKRPLLLSRQALTETGSAEHGDLRQVHGASPALHEASHGPERGDEDDEACKQRRVRGQRLLDVGEVRGGGAQPGRGLGCFLLLRHLLLLWRLLLLGCLLLLVGGLRGGLKGGPLGLHGPCAQLLALLHGILPARGLVAGLVVEVAHRRLQPVLDAAEGVLGHELGVLANAIHLTRDVLGALLGALLLVLVGALRHASLLARLLELLRGLDRQLQGVLSIPSQVLSLGLRGLGHPVVLLAHGLVLRAVELAHLVRGLVSRLGGLAHLLRGGRL